MLIDSKYSKSFISDKLSDSKYKELYDFAITINEHKNIISKHVADNISYYMELSLFDFLKEMRLKYSGLISSNFDKQLYQDVFTSYENKFKAIQNNITFEKLTYKGFELYKRDSKNNKKGELKKINVSKDKTKLSNCLTYLARYSNDNILEYIQTQLNDNNLSEDKIKFYSSILFYINKFGFNRLNNLALQRRDRIINQYNKPIEFKSLTFRGRSRIKTDIISYNENYNSIIKAFINISWLGRGNSMIIPVKYSKEYHGLMKEYHKDTPDVEYMILFTNDKKIKVNICKDSKRYIPDNKTDYIGIDVNIKHNLFTLSDGKTFDYNRKLLNKLSNELSKIDKLKTNKEYIVGRKKQKLIDSYRNKITKSNEKLCSDLCKYMISIGKNHIVMENLDNGFGKSFIKDKNNNSINFNRVVKELRISSLKEMLEHISRNYDISLSTVHSEYTSKQCSKCGCIDDSNRLSQENFKCIECGYEDNADVNAGINIENRVVSTVLRNTLLKQNKIGNGSYEPKILKRDKVKEILLSFRYNPHKVDMDASSMINTFEYI